MKVQNKKYDFESDIREIINNVSSYFPNLDKDLILRAYNVSLKAHAGQKRISGDEYFSHPLAVTKILTEMRLDVSTIITGLLHDTVEDTLITLEDIKKDFGEDITNLVDGVTKLSKIKFHTSEEKQAENFRKMFIAMAQDIRVIIVKLADRLHNMRTLAYIPDNRQQRIAQETIDVYAPLANRLGIAWMKTEMEDLCLRYLKPEIYYKLVQKVAKKKQERQDYIDEVVGLIEKNLEKYNVKGKVSGRPKHFYSIYKKMESQNLDFEQVYDILGFRVIVDKISECYEVLGLVHSIWKPVPGRFKDYIAMPKGNSYQSLHTTVIGPRGERVEIQIRTKEMDLIAEKGIAAHWQYKDGHLDKKGIEKFSWLRQLVEYQKDLKDPSEFLDTVRVDLFPGEIYVFSPKGRVIELPQGSTPVDFAYAIHTQVGEHCVGARVNGKIVPLKHKLHSGDTIEILTDPNRLPSPDWLQFVQTSKAQAKIRKYIKDEQRQRGLQLGRELCNKTFRKRELNFEKLYEKGDLDKAATVMNYVSAEDMVVAVGYGLLSAEQVLKKFLPETVLQTESEVAVRDKILTKKEKEVKSEKSAIRVRGLDDILIHFAKCCNPIRGDSIKGFVTRGRGVTVHVASCSKMLVSDPQRKIDVSWGGETDVERSVKVRVVCQDVQGLLVKMSNVFTSAGVNIIKAQIRTTRDNKAINIFTVSIKNTKQLRDVMRIMEGLDGIISVDRL